MARVRTLTFVTSSPTPTVWGQPVTFTATVVPFIPVGTPTGTVTFVVEGPGGGVFTVPLSGGRARLTLDTLKPGLHSVRASYSGSDRFERSTSASYLHSVLKASTRTTVTSSPDPSVFGQPVTFTATVTAVPPGAGTPTGKVTFVIDALGSIEARLDGNGVATIEVDKLFPGTHPVVAVYRGDEKFNPSAAEGTHTVSPSRLPTTTTVSSSPDPSVFGQPVTLTAVVEPVPPATGTPSGTVTFTVDGEGGGTFTAPLDASGTATVTVSTLGAGPHHITAVYSGDTLFAGSTGSDTHTVNTVSTLTTVTSSPDPSVFGQPVTFTATVTAAFGTVPTGTVTFTISDTGGGTFEVSLDAAGTATLTLDTLGIAAHVVSATYNGDSNHDPSTGTATHEVLAADTALTVESSPDPSVSGQQVTFTATVTPQPPGAGTPEGTVTFLIDGGTALTGTLVNGVATATTSTLPAGSHTVVATYSGLEDPRFNPSTGSDTHTVLPAGTTTTVSSSPDPSVSGQQVTFTATVTPEPPGAGAPTGTVTFDLGSAGTLTAPVNPDGTATVSTTALPAGTSTVSAVYDGDANFTGSSGTTTHTVDQAATAIALFSAPDPSVFGQQVTFTAVVSPVAPGAGVPTGTVTFTVGGAPGVTVPLNAAGIATYTTTDLPAGSQAVVAVYSGDDNFLPVTGSDNQVVARASTTTTVVSSPDPSVFGQPVEVTASVQPVAPGAGVPTGTVTFTVSGGTGGGTFTEPLNAGGTATLTLDTLSVTTHEISAAYSGDDNFAPSLGADTQVVEPAATTTTVVSSPDPSVFGQDTTFTATVTTTAPGGGTPEGTVTFTINGTTLTAPLTPTGPTTATATATTATLPTGTYTVTADYNATADPSHTDSTGTTTHTVNPTDTTTTFTTTPNPSAFGQAVTLTATVTPTTPGTGTPTGTLTFDLGDGTTLTTPLDPTGTATTTLTTLPTGTNTLTATYNPDTTNYIPSTATTTHTVNQTATETVVDGTPDPSVAGEPVLFTAVVTPVAPGAGTPTGTVTFTFTGGGPTLTATLDTTGTATAVTDALPPGLFTVTATYGGDAGFAASSGTTTHTVVQASTTTTVTSFPDPSAFGEDVTFMARVAVDAPGTGVPTGSVTFTFGSGGSATVPLDATGMAVLTESTLPAGTQLVSAFYSGDALHAPSAGAVTHTVTPAVTDTTVVSSPDPSVFGRPVTIAATVTSVAPGAGTPSGSVTFVVSGGTGGGTFTEPLDAGGTATLTLDTLSVTTHAVTATYNGDDPNYDPSTGADTHVVNPADTTSTITSSPNPSVYGQPVTFTGTVEPVPPGAGTPTGTFTGTIGASGTLTQPLINGSASLTVSDLPAGTQTATGTYDAQGDPSFNASDATHNHTVLAADTTTTVITSPDPSAFGQPVVLTATVAPVAPGTGVPTGTLTFTVNGGPLITVPVEVNGTATTTLTTLPTGTRTITATYNAEDPNYNPSNGTTTHTVNQAATGTAVNSTPHPSTLGQLVTFSATVTPVPPGAGTPTGTVTFVIDGGPTLTASLDSDGTATVATAALGVGSSPVTATYNGTTDFATSAGSTVHTVDRAPTTTTVTTSPDPSLFGQNVTFTATVAPVPPGAGTPTGTVTFLVDGGAGGTFTVPLVGGVATASTSTLGIGPHVISAVYSGDAGFATSTGADTHQVDRTPTTTTVTSSPNPSRAGLIATFTATVTPNPPGTGTPTGTVTFVIGNDTLTAALVNGVATVTDRLGTGVYTVTATYSGDAQFAPSTGTHLHEVIPAS